MAVEVGTRTSTEKRKIPNPSLTGAVLVFGVVDAAET